MKKFILVLAVLLAAAPAMAVVNIDATQVGTTAEVDIIVTWSGEGTPPRAFALDITVDNGQTIDAVTNYHTGESRPGKKGFGIFPASFNREIDADDPNWADVNYTPVAEPCDLPGDTQPGVPGTGVTVELGSLYVGGPNVPASPSTLCTITVSDDCNVCFALNVGRAGIVLEDGNAPSSVSMPCVAVDVVVVCTVPNVLDMTEAQANTAITAAGFTPNTTSYDCDNVESADEVLTQNPAGGATPACGTTVDITVSTGPPTVPNVLDMNETEAIAAINAVADISVGNVTYECNDVEAADEVLSQTPSAGVATCGTTVDLVISTGPCCGPCGGWDFDKDGDIDVADYDAQKGKLNWAGWVNSGVYYIDPIDPNTGFLWDTCFDTDKDGDIDVADSDAVKGKLNWAGWVNNGVYYVAPGDPNTGFLWPCP